MTDKKTEALQSSFAERRAAREAAEVAAGGPPDERKITYRVGEIVEPGTELNRA